MTTNRYLVIYWKHGPCDGKGIMRFCKEITGQFTWLTKEEMLEVYEKAKKQNKKNLIVVKRMISFERR